jgi:hypothetical protein
MHERRRTRAGRCLRLLLLGLVALLSSSAGQAQVDPGIRLSLSLNRTSYLFNQPSDPIQVTINLTNVSGAERLVSQGLTTKPLHLQLVFTDPDGQPITTTQVTSGGPDAPPPTTLLVEDQFVQVEAIEHLAAGGGVQLPVADAKAFYILPKAGSYSVKAYVSFATYPAVYRTEADGTEFARLDTATFAGVIESNVVPFALTTDADGDSYTFPVADSRISPQTVPDCNDGDPAVQPGAAEVPGDGVDNDCNPATSDAVPPPAPGTIQVAADSHTVGSGSTPPSNKQPLANLPVRVFTRSAGSCAATIGGGPKEFDSIWASCVPNAVGTTNGSGQASFAMPPGNYVVIGRYDPSPAANDEVYPGKKVDGLASGQTQQVKLKVIVKSNGKAHGAKVTIVTGSWLEIIEPEFVEWSGTQELYPFIFETVGEWTVTATVAPPEGFVADNPSLTREVNTTLAAAQFTITDVGSKWEPTQVTYDLTHKGKKLKVKSNVGVWLSDELAKAKHLTRDGKPLSPGQNKKYKKK